MPKTGVKSSSYPIEVDVREKADYLSKLGRQSLQLPNIKIMTVAGSTIEEGSDYEISFSPWKSIKHNKHILKSKTVPSSEHG
jgi:hypothetical protein